jgi:hypothetical protein
MSVKINVTDSSTPEISDDKKVKIEIVQKDEIKWNLVLKSSLNGDLIILDHKDIDIVIQQDSKKIITFAKETMSDMVYGAEARLLEYLKSHGILQHDSIQGGNVYGSLEGKIMNSKSHNPIKATLLKISEWMNTERPYIDGTTAYDNMQDDSLLEPDNEYSTELGEVPHEEKKGSMHMDSMFAPYLYGRYTY